MNKKNNKTAVFLMGPTASGKTDLIIKLSDKLPIDIISVDSAMIYKGMNIGTGKPSQEILDKTPHYLIDICDPSESYSAAEFCSDALNLVEKSFANNRLPVLVGGTIMYFNSLKYGLSPLPSSDEAIRKKLEDSANKFGIQEMHNRLKEIDPISASRIHPNDNQRILRAIEIFEITGHTLSKFLARESGNPFKYNIESFCISYEKEILDERIEKRFKIMLDQGLEQEIRKLYDRGDLNNKLPSIRSIGYRQMWDYFDGKMNYDEMVYRSIVATRQLAKRQFTWLRSWQDLKWFREQDKAFEQLFSELEDIYKNNQNTVTEKIS